MTVILLDSTDRALLAAAHTWMTSAELAKAAGLDIRRVKNRIPDLARDGLLDRARVRFADRPVYRLNERGRAELEASSD